MTRYRRRLGWVDGARAKVRKNWRVARELNEQDNAREDDQYEVPLPIDRENGLEALRVSRYFSGERDVTHCETTCTFWACFALEDRA